MGHAVEVPDLRGSLRREPCASSFIAATGVAIDRTASDPAVLVAHSRSGPLLPAIAHGCGRSIGALLYVDAALPHPGRSWADEAPPERVATMREMAVDGLLPRWSDWWDPAMLEQLVPDHKVRADLVDEQPRVPSSFLDERLPDLDWPGPAGYLQLSANYAGFAETARKTGWPVEQRALDHLAVLTAPAEVASAMSTLLNALTPMGT
jgi:hypothetical protein